MSDKPRPQVSCRSPLPSDVHFVKVVVVLTVVPQRHQDSCSVETDLRIAHDAVGDLQQRLHLAIAGRVDDLQGTATIKAGRVDLAGLKHGGRVVVIRTILPTHNEQDRVRADQGVREEGVTLQRSQFLFPSALLAVGCLLQRMIKLGNPVQELRTAGISVTKRRAQMLYGCSQREKSGIRGVGSRDLSPRRSQQHDGYHRHTGNSITCALHKMDWPVWQMKRNSVAARLLLGRVHDEVYSLVRRMFRYHASMGGPL